MAAKFTAQCASQIISKASNMILIQLYCLRFVKVAVWLFKTMLDTKLSAISDGFI